MNEPAPTAPFTDEDRARLREYASGIDCLTGDELSAALTRALDRITHLEGALEDARADPHDLKIVNDAIDRHAEPVDLGGLEFDTHEAVALARVLDALPTSKEGE